MNVKIIATIVILLNNFKICQSRRYDKFSLYNVVPMDVEHLKFLQNIQKQKYIDVIFWKRPYKLFEDVQFIVNPSDKELFIERATHFNIKADLLLNDVQSAFDSQTTIKKYIRSRAESFTWEEYHELEDIYQWLTDLALRYPTIIEIESIGQSAEGREIFGLSMKRPGIRPKVIVEAGIHGNEWIAIEFVTYLINELVHSNDTKNGEWNKLVQKYDWFVMPLVNPDGFVYSHKQDRLWKKNRKNFHNIFGVDLNRNFDYNFGKFGASNDAKDESYCGPSAFSELESRAVANFVNRQSERLRFYFSYHAYGQKIIIPYSDRIKHIENFNEMENYGKQAIMKIYKINGTIYSIGTTYDTLGLRISGNSASWVKKNFKVPYVFTLLLRDNGSYGYALPPNQILPTCQETMAGLMQLMTAKPKRVRMRFGRAPPLRCGVLVFFCNFLFLLK